MIEVRDLTVRTGRFSLERISFMVPAGGYAVLMGRTGCGKTTILEALAGLRRIEGGAIRLHGRDVRRLRPADRGVGYVPQDRALFGAMTVADNLGFALSVRRWPAQRIAARVDELARWLGLRHLLDRKPLGLSGGEAQRVALGRALAAEPGVLLLDEPLSALDDQTRTEMYDVLESVSQRTGVTVLHVTHHAEEARRLADCILSLEGGAVVEAIVPNNRGTRTTWPPHQSCESDEPPGKQSARRRL